MTTLTIASSAVAERLQRGPGMVVRFLRWALKRLGHSPDQPPAQNLVVVIAGNLDEPGADGLNELSRAVKSGVANEFIAALLKLGPSLTAPNKDGSNALELAVYRNPGALALFRIERPDEVANGLSALLERLVWQDATQAIAQENVWKALGRLVKNIHRVLAAGARFTPRSFELLLTAVMTHKLPRDLLLEILNNNGYGVKAAEIAQENMSTPGWMHLWQPQGENHEELLLRLIDMGLHLRKVADWGEQPLAHCALYGYRRVAGRLLEQAEYPADLDIRRDIMKVAKRLAPDNPVRQLLEAHRAFNDEALA